MGKSSKSKRQEKGIENDQFYTVAETADNLANFVKTQTWYPSIERVIEPSAGTGAFSNLFPSCIAYDIEPKNPKIIKADFLEQKIEAGPVTLTVGNPPFGRQGSLAVKFIRKACEFSEYIAFILPRSFKKVSVQNKVPLTHSLLHQNDLNDNIFALTTGEIYSVPCVFQIWKRQARDKIQLISETKLFRWCGRDEADFAIRRVGWYAGKVIDDPLNTAEPSHYYVKCNDPQTIGKIKECLKSINWSEFSDMTTGPRSISKPELIQLFERNYVNHEAIGI